MKMDSDVIIGKSKIHEKGVFANRDFKKKEVVIRYNLKPLTKEEFEGLPEGEKHFTSCENGQYYLFSPPERYVNHSCEENTNPINKCDVAVRDIRKGEEITTDYSKDDVPGLNMKCSCGNERCKGVIVNEKL